MAGFPRNRSTKTGRATYCKPCLNVRTKRNKQRRYGGERNFLLKHRYGIDGSEVDAIRTQQGLLCPICLAQPPQHVDHDHGTGKVRGITCFNCNGALGRFEDDITRLRAAMEYLEAHGMDP
jgi:Recombination endonuclease VII